MDRKDRISACLLGALVADAASLGLHWIYDVERIAEVAEHRDGKAAFVPHLAAHYDGVASYFAHALRGDGQFTQYGETLWLSMRSVLAHGRFDVAAYQVEFAAHFGAGGVYQGYIDRPTRGMLANIADGQVDPSGIEDDQLPAVACLPLIVGLSRDATGLMAEVETAIRVTSTHEDALIYGHIVADLLRQVLDGAPVSEALHRVASAGSGPAYGKLADALSTREADPVAYGEHTRRACHLPMAVPLAFHILRQATSYAQAVEMNIRAGGDSAGRAIIIGAVMGARHGRADADGIPLSWILQLSEAAQVWPACQRLAGGV